MRVVTSLACASVILLASTSAGWAESRPIPRYNIDKLCDVIGRGWHDDGPLNQSAKNLCIRNEQEAYSGLKGIWSHFDPDLQEQCESLTAKASYMASYSALNGCLVSLEPEQDSRGRAHFKY